MYNSHRPEYPVYIAMVMRCENPKDKGYKNYGGRGISVCPRWRESFDNFFADMGARPSDKHTLDREDNDGNYEPSNCRWVTMTVQARNTRRNKYFEYKGYKATITELCEIFGKNSELVCGRIYNNGWSIEDAMEKPVLENSVYEYKGKTQGVFAWAREYGLETYILRHRMQQLGWDFEKALLTPVRPKERLIEYKGITQSLTKWCKELDIPYSSVIERLRSGCSTQEAFERPFKSTHKITYKGKTQPIKEWCEELGLVYNTIRLRIYKEDPIEVLEAAIAKRNKVA